MKKLLIAAGGILAAVLVLVKGSSLTHFVKVLSITPKLDGGMKRMTFKSGKLQIPIAVDFHNRSDEEVTVAVPSFFLYFKDKQVGSVKPNSNKVLIKKYATSTLSNIIVEVPWTKLLSIFGDVINVVLQPPYDYSLITSAIRMEITCIINDSLVITLNKKLDETEDVNINQKSGAVGLVPYSQRKIRSIDDYVDYIAPQSELKYEDKVVIPDGTTEETVELMKRISKEYARDTRLLAQKLRKGTLEATLQSIFDFIYTHIAYVPDSRVQEQVRRPLRTLWDQKGDCDCYATLIGSILTNLGIPYKFRIAAYGGKPYYQHVYVIVPHGAGEYYTVDPVLDHCFEEKKPSKYKDF